MLRSTGLTEVERQPVKKGVYNQHAKKRQRANGITPDIKQASTSPTLLLLLGVVRFPTKLSSSFIYDYQSHQLH